jgi:hypothetical protein
MPLHVTVLASVAPRQRTRDDNGQREKYRGRCRLGHDQLRSGDLVRPTPTLLRCSTHFLSTSMYVFWTAGSIAGTEYQNRKGSQTGSNSTSRGLKIRHLVWEGPALARPNGGPILATKRYGSCRRPSHALSRSHPTFAPPTIDHPERLLDRALAIAIRPSANFSKEPKAI